MSGQSRLGMDVGADWQHRQNGRRRPSGSPVHGGIPPGVGCAHDWAEEALAIKQDFRVCWMSPPWPRPPPPMQVTMLPPRIVDDHVPQRGQTPLSTEQNEVAGDTHACFAASYDAAVRRSGAKCRGTLRLVWRAERDAQLILDMHVSRPRFGHPLGQAILPARPPLVSCPAAAHTSRLLPLFLRPSLAASAGPSRLPGHALCGHRHIIVRPAAAAALLHPPSCEDITNQLAGPAGGTIR